MLYTLQLSEQNGELIPKPLCCGLASFCVYYRKRHKEKSMVEESMEEESMEEEACII